MNLDGTWHELGWWGGWTGRTFRFTGFDRLAVGESITMRVTRTATGLTSVVVPETEPELMESPSH